MTRIQLLLLTLAVSALPGCIGPSPPEGPPNVLWVLWDTVRADHLSLYGHPLPTTPFLDEWARQARVFEDCTSPGTITSSSHASLFTGLLPSEHGTDNRRSRLHPRHHTIAEILRDRGYRSFLWSANPNIADEADFHQGFDRNLHPWSDGYQARARQIVEDKILPQDQSSELPKRLATPNVSKHAITASGSLAREALSQWLDEGDERPYFAFLNYMEAHRPLIPAEKYRSRMMSPADVARSYEIDRSWDAIWSYTFGLQSFSNDELRVMSGTYDAAIAELDDLFKDLLTTLEAKGQLDNTIVALTSDHGEHLGEHHLLDHQYSVYQPLTRVPLILHAPSRIPPGRETRPVMSFDLFPTLLELCGVDPPAATVAQTHSLLRPKTNRLRLTEYPAPFRAAMRSVSKLYPDWQPDAWTAELRALTHRDYKLITRSGAASELYDLGTDPDETVDLATSEPERRAGLEDLMARQLAELSPDSSSAPPPAWSKEQRKRLQALGYLDSSEPAPVDDETRPATEGGAP